MKYTGMYIWPPRPSTQVKPFSESFEKIRNTPGWIAQYKLNGQRNGLYFHPDGQLRLWDRTKGQHLNYSLPGWLETELRDVIKPPPGQWMIVDSELLHAKDASIKNTIYLYDLLVMDGEHLLRTTYRERHSRLLKHLGRDADECPAGDIAIRLSNHVWAAFNIAPPEWQTRWEKTKISYVEGFVLKWTAGKLLPGMAEDNNSSWMIRCRKPTGNGHIRF